MKNSQSAFAVISPIEIDIGNLIFKSFEILNRISKPRKVKSFIMFSKTFIDPYSFSQIL